MQSNASTIGSLTPITRIFVIALGATGMVAAWLLIGAIPQDPLYHLFADQRDMLAIPNAHNVLSNLPFCLVGLIGMIGAFNQRDRLREQTGMYLVFFGAVFFTGFGSAYYHVNPTNLTLVWDRLPMAIGFMSILAAITAERIDPKLGRRLMPYLLLAGIGSVLYWHGFDDLRPYALVQFGSLLALLAILVFRPRPGSTLLWLALAFYVLAKVFEAGDVQVFALSAGQVSGHALKHLAAAITPLLILLHMKNLHRGHSASMPEMENQS